MDKTYKRHSFTKLWIATAMFIFCCFATSAFAQEAVDAFKSTLNINEAGGRST